MKVESTTVDGSSSSGTVNPMRAHPTLALPTSIVQLETLLAAAGYVVPVVPVLAGGSCCAGQYATATRDGRSYAARGFDRV